MDKKMQNPTDQEVLNICNKLDHCNNFFNPSTGITPTGYPFILQDIDFHLGDCIPNQAPNTLYFTIETEDCINIGIPDRGSLFQFIAHTAQSISDNITQYPGCSPYDDVTNDVQNALDYLSELSMLDEELNSTLL